MRNSVPGFNNSTDANGYYIAPFIRPNTWQIGCTDFNVSIYIDKKTYPKLIDSRSRMVVMMNLYQTIKYVSNNPMQIPTLDPQTNKRNFTTTLMRQFIFEAITEFLNEITGRICNV
jgi:hypothetical protein